MCPSTLLRKTKERLNSQDASRVIFSFRGNTLAVITKKRHDKFLQNCRTLLLTPWKTTIFLPLIFPFYFFSFTLFFLSPFSRINSEARRKENRVKETCYFSLNFFIVLSTNNHIRFYSFNIFCCFSYKGWDDFRRKLFGVKGEWDSNNLLIFLGL